MHDSSSSAKPKPLPTSAPVVLRLVPPAWHRMWRIWLKSQNFKFPDAADVDDLEERFYHLIKQLGKESKGIKRGQ